MLRNFFKNKKYIFSLVMAVFIMACKQEKRSVNVADIELQLAFHRFENELFEIKPPEVKLKIEKLEKKHPVFYKLFKRFIVRSEDKNDSISKVNLLNFVNDQEIQSVYQETKGLYSDLTDIKKDLQDGFKRYKKLFPEKVIPSIYTFISGFNYAVISADSILGVGLDMYLGANCKYYPALGLPKYKMNNMRKEYVVSDAMKGWIQSDYPIDESKKDFLSHIIYYGKLLYFQDVILPEAPDTIKMGYTATQLSWCQKNESSIWAFFISQKLLYNAGYTDYHKFINEGPSTNGFPKESPSLLGNWIGWQIVRKYMDENPGVTVKQLFLEQNAQKILTDSKYKPKK